MSGGVTSKMGVLGFVLGAGAIVGYLLHKKSKDAKNTDTGKKFLKESLSNVSIASTGSVKSLVGSIKPMVVAGPSGVGKGTLLDMLFTEFPGCFEKSVSHTTRPPRAGEKDGVHYHFTTMDKMKQEIAEGKFIESAEVHGKMYGTSFAAVKAVGDAGKVCILEIDVQGVESIRHTDLDAYYVFFYPPSHEALKERLTGRGSETDATLQKRLNGALAELKYMEASDFSDFDLVNDDLESAYKKLKQKVLELYPHLARKNSYKL